jgi:hypothetical protein
MRFIAPLAAIALGSLLLGAPAATAAPAKSACSPVAYLGKQICLTVTSSTATATLTVDSGGRGWYGQVEIDGPHGKLLRTGDHGLGAPASWSNSHATDGTGKYCAIDWRWDVYHDTYFTETSVCVTV